LTRKPDIFNGKTESPETVPVREIGKKKRLAWDRKYRPVLGPSSSGQEGGKERALRASNMRFLRGERYPREGGESSTVAHQGAREKSGDLGCGSISGVIKICYQGKDTRLAMGLPPKRK